MLKLPDIDAPIWSAQQASEIDAIPRNTILGWIARYPEMGIEPVKPGVTRLFTLRQIGLLATVRIMLDAGLPGESVMRAIPDISTFSETFFASIAPLARYDNGIKLAPDEASYIVARKFLGTTWVCRLTPNASSETGAQLKDTAGFPAPVLIVPLSQILVNAWERALTLLMHGKLGD